MNGPSFDKMASEGVIAIKGTIPSNAVEGLLRVPKPATGQQVHAALQALFGGG